MAKLINKDYVEALARGLEVIKAFSISTPVMTSAQVAAKTGLARPTVHRLLLTLQSLGYVRNDLYGFSLTPRVVDLGMAYISARGMWDIARPHMEEFVKLTDQCCSLSQLVEADTVLVAGVTTPKVLTFTMTLGTRSPVRSTSMGDVLLADLSEDELRRTLSMPSRALMHARTSRSDEEFSVVLPQVRRQGYAISDERLSLGIRVVSVPIVDRNERTVVCLNTPALVAEVTVDQLRDAYLPLLLVTAGKISVDLAKFNELPVAIIDPADDMQPQLT